MGILGRLKYSGKAARKGLAISLFWLFCVLLANAAQEYTVETIPNVRLTNRLNHVSNPDGILLPDHVARINAVLGQLEDSLGIEVAVVAVESILEVGNEDPCAHLQMSHHRVKPLAAPRVCDHPVEQFCPVSARPAVAGEAAQGFQLL